MRNIIPLVSISQWSALMSPDTTNPDMCRVIIRGEGSDAFTKYAERNSLCTSVQKCWPQLLTWHRQMKWNAVLILQSQYHPWPNSDYVITCVWRKGWFCQYFPDWFCLIVLDLSETLTPHSSLLKSNHKLNTWISPHGRPWLLQPYFDEAESADSEASIIPVTDGKRV